MQISHKKEDTVSVGGEAVSGLKPDHRDHFKRFVEDRYVSDDKYPSKDVFFAHFDKALDAVDPDFRVRHGIFFTDLDLSRFTMWFVKRQLGDIGKNYLVIDPACGSGNLVTNWRSPLELRHKVVSEIEPELLFAIERRMQGDEWHNGKFTVVPKVSEGKGLNFLDKSADEYLEIIKTYLNEKGLKPDKPIAFLCNPPYRSDDDQSASAISYEIHPSIVDLTSKDGSSERYCCFLAQMKLICERAESSGLPGNSLLLLFTKAAWLTDRPVFQKIRSEILTDFEEAGGIIVNSKEFFDVKVRFPVAFTIWKYTSGKSLDPKRPINIIDLTWVKKQSMSQIRWDSALSSAADCELILADKRSVLVPFGYPKENIKSWSTQTRKDIQRERRKSESTNDPCGLPLGDHRHARKKRLGEKDGNFVAFLDDLTPCRIKTTTNGVPWFRLNNQFMDCRKTRCLSGPPDNRGFFAGDKVQTTKTFIWFALGRTFASEGYPMWVDAMEMWGLEPTPNITKIAYAIGFAENECVETIFPANDPIRGIPELFVINPLSPNSKDSFWSKEMKPIFVNDSSAAHRLVNSVDRLFSNWEKYLGDRNEITVTYKRPYFIGRGKLSANSGIVQIVDYAKEMDVKELLDLFKDVQENLNKVKKIFHEMLLNMDQVNYFGQPKILRKELISSVSTGEINKSKFQKILDLRLAIAAHIIDELQNDSNFGRTKFAKALYLVEQVAEVDLQTTYYREAAGPLDQRALYNEKIGIEAEGEKRGLFAIHKKLRRNKDERTEMVKYVPAKKIKQGIQDLKDLVKDGQKLTEIDRVIRLVEPMTTDQAEIVATLYAAWNDLIIKGKNSGIEDEAIIKEVREAWHERKKRFSGERLTKAINWMRQRNLIPKGKGKLTQVKMNF